MPGNGSASWRDTDSDWEEVATDNPYWGVLSADQFKGRELSAKAKQEFFASGDEFIGNVFAFVRKHLKEEFQPTRSLDFGCGVGRLLIPIARRSKEAVGLDVSQRMLNLCNAHLSDHGIDNAITVQNDDVLSNVIGTFDFVNTYIVLQHIPPARGYVLLQALLAKLVQGGVASMQLTFGKHRRFLIHEAGRAQFYRREEHMLFDIGPPIESPPLGTITMYDYDLNNVVSIINAVAGSPVLMLPTNDDDHLGTHFIFMKARD
jgi:2-polyprenyl-3-methyl-5-hydroxy-6-metoxy-1,4-benzoquinol methylase